MKVLLLLMLASGMSGGCMPVTGDRIFGRDLALVDPRFSALAPTLVLAAAPTPGMRRTLSAPELSRIARANGIPVTDPTEVCFEFPMRILALQDVLSAMRLSLPAAVELDVIDFPGTEVPVGKPMFPVSALGPVSVSDRGTRLWRGFVQYTATRRLEIWARVTLSQTISAVVAKRDLAANVPIGQDDVEARTWKAPFTQELHETLVADVIGRAPRKAVSAGSPIPVSILQPRLAVRRGESVKVEVLCGTAKLMLDAIAVREAREGELVELRNPSSGKLFLARMDAAKAVVLVSPGQKL